jgi:hypothetical protein
MKFIFVAVGGSGTKVADALVNMLTIGFPTRQGETGLGSEGDLLEIWRVDPDGSSGAADSLRRSVDNYNRMQDELGGKWGLTIDPEIRHLDPLKLPTRNGSDNQIKTLAGILDSGYEGALQSKSFLNLFYETKDLEVAIDRGFYQKPFIGSAVMAVFADSLQDGNSAGGSQCRITHHQNLEVRFFLCGSLHGGTGACGVPVLGKYLRDVRDNMQQANKWMIGGCLLTPYATPPDPPFNKLDDETVLSEDLITDRVQQFGTTDAFRGLSITEQRELAKQILLGFYADSRDVMTRAGQGLLYYQDHAGDCFDALYLAGKPSPDELKTWSNGGKNQRNPSNSAEMIAALAALDFFSAANPKQDGYLVGGSTDTVQSSKLRFTDLPHYRVGNTEVDPERVFLAMAAAYHCLFHEVSWEEEVARWNKRSLPALKDYYQRDDEKKDRDYKHFKHVGNLLIDAIGSLISPERSLGWNHDMALAFDRFLSANEETHKTIRKKMERKGMFGNQPREPVSLDHWQIEVTAFEFGTWAPNSAEFTRGEYLRYVWQKLYEKVPTERPTLQTSVLSQHS